MIASIRPFAFLFGPLDPASRPNCLPEISRVARLARRHLLGRKLKSQRVLAEVTAPQKLVQQ